MKNYPLHDERQWLKNEIVPELLRTQKIFQNFRESDSQDFFVKGIELKLVGSKEAFMLTTCYKANIQCSFRNIEMDLHLFVKKTPPGLPQEVFDSVNFAALFSNEILAYEKIMPALEEFSQTNFKLPKFYYGLVTKNSACIVMEDFGKYDFKMCDKMFSIREDHVLMAVKYLAEFHGLGLGWRFLKPTTFHQNTKDLKEARYSSEPPHTWNLILEAGKQRALKVARQYSPMINEGFLEKYVNLDGVSSFEHAKKLLKPCQPYETLCHGDYLRNNIAFKYKHKPPIDIIMFDLQTFRVSSPMVDLTIFLSLSSFKEVRCNKFKEIFKLYCDTLQRKYLSVVPGTLPEHLTQPALLKEYIKYLPYSISICSAFLMDLVEPRELNSQEFLTAQRTDEEIVKDAMTRGGAIVDIELAHQIKEMYELMLGPPEE